MSVYGVATANPWRWLEHAGWVAFTDIFLDLGLPRESLHMRQALADQRALLEANSESMKQHLARVEAEREARSAAIVRTALDCIITIDAQGRVSRVQSLGGEDLRLRARGSDRPRHGRPDHSAGAAPAHREGHQALLCRPASRACSIAASR